MVQNITGLIVLSMHGSSPSSLGMLQKWANMSLPCVSTPPFSRLLILTINLDGRLQ